MLKLSEAQAIYVDPNYAEDGSRINIYAGEKLRKLKPYHNRKIRVFLKQELRKRAELLLSKPWSEILWDYVDGFTFHGSPKTGWVSLRLSDSTVCYGFGAVKRPDIVIGFRQSDLFEGD